MDPSPSPTGTPVFTAEGYRHSQIPPSSLLQGRLVEPYPAPSSPSRPCAQEATDQVPGAAIVPMAGAAAALPGMAREKTPHPPKPGHDGESGASCTPPLSRRGPGWRLAGAGVDLLLSAGREGERVNEHQWE